LKGALFLRGGEDKGREESGEGKGTGGEGKEREGECPP